MQRVAKNLRGNMRLAMRRLHGGAPAQGVERTTLQRIAVATTVLVFSLVLPTVDSQWQLRAPDAVSIAVGAGPTRDRLRDRDASAARAPRHRDLILGSGVRAAMSRMTAGY